MLKDYRPAFYRTANIVDLISKISRLQGELDTLPHSSANAAEIEVLAAADSIHYSTAIEGNRLTLKQVTDVIRHPWRRNKSTRDFKEVLNYAQARHDLMKRSENHESLTHQLILAVHGQLLKGIVRGRLKGHYRESQNVIRESVSRAIVYLPPEEKDVRPLISSLLLWTGMQTASEESSLIVAPVFHYRFVTIHPFLDGNGRAARLLTNYILLLGGFNVMTVAAIEKQHELDRARYYRELRRLQASTFYDIPEDIDVTSWIEYWLGCLQATYEEAVQRLQPLRMSDELLNLPPRLQTAVSLFRKFKRLSAREYQGLTGLGRTRAVSDLNQLLTGGYIRRVGRGRSLFYAVAVESSTKLSVARDMSGENSK